MDGSISNDLVPGVSIAVLHAILLYSKTGPQSPHLTCDNISTMCLSRRALDAASVPSMTRIRLKADFDALISWATTPDAQDAVDHALTAPQLLQPVPHTLLAPTTPAALNPDLVAALTRKLLENPNGTTHADLLNSNLEVGATDLNAILEVMQADGILYIHRGKYHAM